MHSATTDEGRFNNLWSIVGCALSNVKVLRYAHMQEMWAYLSVLVHAMLANQVY